MGIVYTEITLKNAWDDKKVQDGLIKAEAVRAVTVQALVDTGAMSLCITEELCRKLGLAIREERFVQVANGHRVKCKVTEPVEIYWKNRYSALSAVVVPGAPRVLLGAIPLEDLDLMVNPVTQEVVGIHGDEVETMIMQCGSAA